MKIIDRYVLKELGEPFMFGLTSFTLILSASMVLFELVRAIVQAGMPVTIAAQLFLFRLPSVMVYIFPMAMLLAAILSFGRFSSDREVIAFRAGGVSLYRLMVPVMGLGLAVSLLTMGFYEVVVPQATAASQALLIQAKIEHAPKMQNNVFMPEIENGMLKRIFYANRLEGSLMDGVIIQEFSNGQLSQIVQAKTASWQKDKWVFNNGTNYFLGATGEYKHTIKFDQQVIAIKFTPADFYVGEKKPEELNYGSLKEYIALRKKTGADTKDYEIQLNMKLALPFACFVFALLGAPLGLNPTRKSSSIGLGISVIIIFVYYVLMFIGMASGMTGLLEPVWAAWMPNIVTALIGAYILYKAGR